MEFAVGWCAGTSELLVNLLLGSGFILLFLSAFHVVYRLTGKSSENTCKVACNKPVIM